MVHNKQNKAFLIRPKHVKPLSNRRVLKTLRLTTIRNRHKRTISVLLGRGNLSSKHVFKFVRLTFIRNGQKHTISTSDSFRSIPTLNHFNVNVLEFLVWTTKEKRGVLNFIVMLLLSCSIPTAFSAHI